MSDDMLRPLLDQAQVVELPAGKQIYHEGDTCGSIAFLVDGAVRVFKTGETGREITLYEIDPGETCILTASCILSNMGYPAQAITLTPIKVVLIPAATFKKLVDTADTMREFVFSILSRRLAVILALVEEITFRKMDERLSDYLKEKEKDGVINATHQAIANDLGTSREVVSRLLKDFENSGMLSLSRNRITLTR